MKQILLLCLTFSCLINAQAQSEQAIIQEYLQQNFSKWSVQAADFNGIEITSTASSKAEGVKHYYVRQTLKGYPVVNGVGSLTIKNKVVIDFNYFSSISPNFPLVKELEYVLI